jgi:hypothetical protein
MAEELIHSPAPVATPAPMKKPRPGFILGTEGGFERLGSGDPKPNPALNNSNNVEIKNPAWRLW